MKKIPMIIAALLASITMTACGCVDKVSYEVWDTQDLTEDYLAARDGKLIVERIIGVCLDSEGNGRVLNMPDGRNYISYRNVTGIEPGDIICTFCVYNDETNYTDDVVCRWDEKVFEKSI